MSYLPAPARYERLPYRRSGRSGLDLPAISLGLWQNFGGVDGDVPLSVEIRGTDAAV
jgi:L-glyceraldehyde 3-phosphate reductase